MVLASAADVRVRPDADDERDVPGETGPPTSLQHGSVPDRLFGGDETVRKGSGDQAAAARTGPEWISIGDRTFIRDFARIEAIKAPGAPDPVLSIGSDVLVEEDLHVTCTRSVVIEDQVLISARAYISDTSHAMPSGRGNVVTTLIRGGAIRIGFGTMIGVGVSVLSGVSIGRYCVIGANSVVTHDIPDGMVAAGSPARVIKPNPAAPPQRTTSEPSGAR